MDELKPCMSLDEALSIVDPDSGANPPKGESLKTTVALFEQACRMVCDAARRTAPENKSLTCEECAYEPYAPSEVHCIGCARMYGDRYARKPEVE